MSYPIKVSIVSVLYSILAVYIRTYDISEWCASEAGESLLALSLLLVPVACASGMALGWFFHVVGDLAEGDEALLGKTYLQMVSRVSFWIPPLAPTLSSIVALLI